jgi:LPS export ABC transporter protein LptC
MRALPGILLAAALAASACGDDRVQPTAVRDALADSADQVMFGVRTLVTNGGVLRAELFADTAYVFDENTRYELRGVRTHFFAATGARSAVLTSREGTYDTRRARMEARGDVVVTGEDGRRLVTEQLQFQQQRNEIASDSAFVLTEPNGRRLEGIGFTSDPDMRNVRVLRAARGKAGVVEDPAMRDAGPAGSTFKLPRGGPP